VLKSLEDAEIDKESFFRSSNLTGRLTYEFYRIPKASRVCFTPYKSLSHEEICD
jgi:hypothetical protein